VLTAYSAAAPLNADVIWDVVVGNIRHHSDEIGRVADRAAWASLRSRNGALHDDAVQLTIVLSTVHPNKLNLINTHWKQEHCSSKETARCHCKFRSIRSMFCTHTVVFLWYFFWRQLPWPSLRGQQFAAYLLGRGYAVDWDAFNFLISISLYIQVGAKKRKIA